MSDELVKEGLLTNAYNRNYMYEIKRGDLSGVYILSVSYGTTSANRTVTFDEMTFRESAPSFGPFVQQAFYELAMELSHTIRKENFRNSLNKVAK